MARNPMQDIVRKDGKSIRNIPLGESRPRVTVQKEIPKPEKKKKVDKDEVYEKPVRIHRQVEESDEEVIEKVRKELEDDSLSGEKKISRKKNKRIYGTIFGIVAVIGLALLASSIFKGAILTVTPRTANNIKIAADFTAKKSGDENQLAYAVVTIKQTDSETLSATGEKQVDKRATGIITIFNNYSTAPQRLIKNTRFATPEGLIYRIADSVTVPGKKGTVPGSVEATILADESGEKYNVGLKDFTIPGFKGDPRYAAFYARSKTALTGGFSGKQKIVADADRVKAKTAIESRLTTELSKQIELQIPANKVSFDKAYKIDFMILPEESTSGSQVTIKEEGVLSLVVFDKNEISASMAKAQIKDYRGDPILVTNLDSIVFAPKGDFKPAGGDTISFTLSGDANFEWMYDEVALKQALLGKERSGITTILQKFPMIEKADITLRPFWAIKFPTSFDKIVIKKKI